MSRANDIASYGNIPYKKNLIINGDMSIWQRGTVFNPGNGVTYGPDRFSSYSSIGALGDLERSTLVPSNRFEYSVKFSGDLRHCIEIPLNGGVFQQNENFTLSFWMKSDSAISLNVNLRFADDSNATNSGSLWNNISISTDSTWSKYELTFNVGSNVPNGTTNQCVFVYFEPGDLNVFKYLTGIQLEKGTNSTEFEYIDFSTNLLLCQRYFTKSYAYTHYAGTDTFENIITIRNYNTYDRASLPVAASFPVQMKIKPTITYYSKDGVVGKLSDLGSGFDLSAVPYTNVLITSSVYNDKYISKIQLSTFLRGTMFGGIHYTAEADF